MTPKRPPPLRWSQATGWPEADGMTYVLPVPMPVNRIWRHAKGRTYKVKAAKQDDTNAALLLPKLMAQGEVAVMIEWYRHAKVGDVDSRIKATLDLLSGIAYADDKQVAFVSCYRIDDGSPARMVVRVRVPARVPARVAA